MQTLPGGLVLTDGVAGTVSSKFAKKPKTSLEGIGVDTPSFVRTQELSSTDVGLQCRWRGFYMGGLHGPGYRLGS